MCVGRLGQRRCLKVFLALGEEEMAVLVIHVAFLKQLHWFQEAFLAFFVCRIQLFYKCYSYGKFQHAKRCFTPLNKTAELLCTVHVLSTWTISNTWT